MGKKIVIVTEGGREMGWDTFPGVSPSITP